MVDCVTHQVSKRIFDGFDNGLIKLGLLAFHLDSNFLLAHGGEVSNEAWKLAPDSSNWLHPSLHDSFLQFGCYQIQSLSCTMQGRIIDCAVELKDLVSGKY
jgi:hypothetical protein